MTMFVKRKKAEPVTPRPCDRCREHPGVVHLYALDVPRSAAASSDQATSPETDWWLCSDCARRVGRDEPEGG